MEQHDLDEADYGEAKGSDREAYRIKMFEPDSRKFFDETRFLKERTTSVSASGPSIAKAVPTERNYVIPDPLSGLPSFQFVSLDGQGPGSPTSRSTVRAHVMRQVRKEKDIARRSKEASGRDQRTAGPTKPTFDDGESSSAHTSPRRFSDGVSWSDFGKESKTQLLSGAEEKSKSRSFSLQPRSGHSRTPHAALFRAMPALGSSSPADMKHIRHYFQVFAKPLLPMSHLEEARWFWKVLDDEVCYHSTLFVSRAHQAILSRGEGALDLHCLGHKGEAIRKINERLSKCKQSLDDGSIAAITCLAVYENLFGAPETATIHVRGLETIGKLRGGFHSTDMPGFLERLVHWLDLSNTTAVRGRSRFIFQDQLSVDSYDFATADSIVFNESWRRQNKGSSPVTMICQQHKGMNVSAAFVFDRLQRLSHIRAQVQSVRDLDADTLYHFTSYVWLLEQYLNTVINAGMGNCLRPEQCMPLYGAALAFIYVAFRDIPVSSPVLGNLTARFKRVLSGMGMDAFCQHFSCELLLWILFLMTWIGQERQDRQWYLDAMTWLLKRLELCAWDEVKNVLATFCMLGNVCEDPYHKIWLQLGYE